MRFSCYCSDIERKKPRSPGETEKYEEVDAKRSPIVPSLHKSYL